MTGLMPQAEFERLAILLGQGLLDQLERDAAQAAERYPGDGRSWQLVGVSHLAQGRNETAVDYLSRASETMPANAAIWDNLGLAHFRLRDFGAAATCFARATALQGDLLSAWVNWSANSCAAGDAAAAEHQARRAVQIQVGSAAGWLNLGNALLDQARLDQAETALANALRLEPGLIDARQSYGMVLDARGRQAEAVRCFESVLALSPGNWRALANLGKIHSAMGDSARASACYRQALQSADVADEVYSGLLFLRLYEDGADPADVLADHRAFGIRVETRLGAAAPRHANGRDPDKCLRLGFVSGDFRQHPVAHFFEPFLEALDRGRFSVVLYSSHPVEDDVSERLAGMSDRWRRVSRMSDDELARTIREDEVDILVDLAGHSSYNRLPVFARRPAPVQVSWLGYPATTGMQSVDYRPIYAAADPDRDLDTQFTEKLVRLHCAPGFRHPVPLPDSGRLPALDKGYVTFGNLNRSDKLGDGVVRVGCRILDALPAARLVLGGIPNPEVGARLVQRFAAQGVGSDRLQIELRRPMSGFLALHGAIDLLLDPFPFSGLTTTEHSVSMGVPVLTLAGSGLVSRQGLVVMGSLGLEDWVARSEDEYVGKAIEFASNLEELAELRAELPSRSLLAADGAREARCLEGAFREMWKRWCAGLPPCAFDVGAERRIDA